MELKYQYLSPYFQCLEIKMLHNQCEDMVKHQEQVDSKYLQYKENTVV